MNPLPPDATVADVAAAIELRNRHVPEAVTDRILELADGGLDLFEIQKHTGIALPLIRLVLRGAKLGAKR